MAIAGPHMAVIMLTSYLNDVNFQIGKVSETRQQVTSQETELYADPEWYSNHDTQVKLVMLKSKDNQLDMMQKKFETLAKSITANLESQQKLLDNNIKKDFGTSLSL